jgi:hypothetical protein
MQRHQLISDEKYPCESTRTETIKAIVTGTPGQAKQKLPFVVTP